MTPSCPSCDKLLIAADDATEHGSGDRLLACVFCELLYRQDPSGLVVELGRIERQ